MRFAVLFFCFSLGSYLQAQNDSLSLYRFFIETTIDDYFSGRFFENEVLTKIFIQNDTLTAGIKNQYSNFTVDVGNPKLLAREYKDSLFYMVGINKISLDTIDVLISQRRIHYRRRFLGKDFKGKRRWVSHRYFIGVGCGGTMGYIPEGRFALNNFGTWDYISGYDIMDQKLDEETQLLKRMQEKHRKNNNP